MRVLLVEPWYGGSHRAWADGWAAASSHDIDMVTLPDRFWRRRLRVGAAELAPLVDRWVDGQGRPDVVVATSMVDLAALMGASRRSLGDVPVVLYCHENQLVYPHPDQVAAPDVDAAARSLQSLTVADRVVVNSQHHLEEMGVGACRVIRDLGLAGGAVERRVGAALDAAIVVPVGVDLAWCDAAGDVPGRDRGALDGADSGSGDPVVLWPHRWDGDKAPDAMVRTLERLAAEGVAFGVVLAGEDGWDGQGRRRDALERLGSRVVASGLLSPGDYRHWVRRADVVVSTARHEYFGVAVVEAMAAGCVPVLPDRCSYPELIPGGFHAAALYPDGGFGRRLREVLADLPAARAGVAGLAGAMARFDRDAVAPQLDAAVAGVAVPRQT
jgi:glycosyltransferase involved in cell wall biosynthesis